MHHVILYDGLCGLCDGFVQFILRRDRRDVFRFSALQGTFATSELRRYGKNPDQINTVVVLRDFDSSSPRLLDKGAAALFILRQLNFWNSIARVAGLLPTWLIDALYNVVARYRYRVFGKLDACPMPSEEHRYKFI